MEEKGKRISLRIPLVVGGVGFAASGVAFLAFGLFIYWTSPRLINFLAAWIPFVLSVLFAFVPSGKEMKHRWIKWVWRGAVVIIGFSWSVMLWHQQDLNDQASSKQTQDAVNQAVTKANEHSDGKFDGVNQQVGTLEGTVEGVNKQQIQLTQDFAKATGDINTNLGKVGKPDPPVPAKLTFSLWDLTATAENPVLSKIVKPDSDGNFPVDITFTNASESTADSIDVWIQLCDKCTFVKEPAGFEKPAGMELPIRHRMFGSINPGVSWEKITLLVKFSDPGPFQIVFRYTCKNCGGKVSPNQVATIIPNSAPMSMQLE